MMSAKFLVFWPPHPLYVPNPHNLFAIVQDLGIPPLLCMVPHPSLRFSHANNSYDIIGAILKWRLHREGVPKCRRSKGACRGGEDRPEFDLDQRSDLCQWSYLCSAKYQLKRQDLDQDQDLRSRSYHVHRHTLGLEIFGFCPLPWSHTLCTHTQETGYSLAYCYMQSFAIS